MITTALNTDRIIADLNALSDDLKNQAVKLGIAKVAASGLVELQQRTPYGARGDVRSSLTKRQLAQRARTALAVNDGTYAMLVGPNRKVKGMFRSRIFNILDGGAKAHGIFPGKTSRVRELLYAQGMARPKRALFSPLLAGQFAMSAEHPGTQPIEILSLSDAALGSQAESIFFTTVQQFLDRRAA